MCLGRLKSLMWSLRGGVGQWRGRGKSGSFWREEICVHQSENSGAFLSGRLNLRDGIPLQLVRPLYLRFRRKTTPKEGLSRQRRGEYRVSSGGGINNKVAVGAERSPVLFPYHLGHAVVSCVAFELHATFGYAGWRLDLFPPYPTHRCSCFFAVPHPPSLIHNIKFIGY